MKKMHTITLAGLLAAAACGSALAGSYSISWNAVDCGGGVASSASYRVNGSIGQSSAGFTRSMSLLHWVGFWSGDVPVPAVAPTIRDAKLLADGTYVSVSGKIATSTESDYSGFFYLEESNRSSGIRVAFPIGSVDGIVRGKSVLNVLGSMGTTPTGERQIAASIIIITSTNLLALGPMGINNRCIGGSDFGVLPLGQYGITDGVGLNNIGLFIKTWGRVDYVDNSYMLISDGSGQAVQVDTSGLLSLPAKDDYIGIIGISSLRLAGGDRLPLVLPLNTAGLYQP